MPSAADTLIARLQADCTAAEAAERTVRAEVGGARRRSAPVPSLGGGWARSATWRASQPSRPDREIAVERQLVALFRDIGWIDGGLDELGEGARPLLDWLQPIAEALHAVAHPVADDAGEAKRAARLPIRSLPFAPSRPGARRTEASPSCRCSSALPPTPVVEF